MLLPKSDSSVPNIWVFFIRIIFFAKCKTFFISLNVTPHDNLIFNWPMTTDKWNVFSTICLKFHLLLFPYGLYSVFVSENTLLWLMSLCSLTLHQQIFCWPISNVVNFLLHIDHAFSQIFVSRCFLYIASKVTKDFTLFYIFITLLSHTAP